MPITLLSSGDTRLLPTPTATAKKNYRFYSVMGSQSMEKETPPHSDDFYRRDVLVVRSLY